MGIQCGALQLLPVQCRGKWALQHMAWAEDNAHRSSSQSGKEDPERSIGETTTLRSPVWKQGTALLAHSDHPWLSSRVCVTKLFRFSPWRPHLGVSALAAWCWKE